LFLNRQDIDLPCGVVCQDVDTLTNVAGGILVLWYFERLKCVPCECRTGGCERRCSHASSGGQVLHVTHLRICHPIFHEYYRVRIQEYVFVLSWHVSWSLVISGHKNTTEHLQLGRSCWCSTTSLGPWLHWWPSHLPWGFWNDQQSCVANQQRAHSHRGPHERLLLLGALSGSPQFPPCMLAMLTALTGCF
jgi:hypothetical protein